MLRDALCCFLILTLVGLDRPVLAAEQSPDSANDLRRQLALIPAGRHISVKLKLKLKGTWKFTGKLGPVTDDGFEVHGTVSGQSYSEQIAFADVESVKVRSRFTTTLYIIGGVLLGAAALYAAIACHWGGAC